MWDRRERAERSRREPNGAENPYGRMGVVVGGDRTGGIEKAGDGFVYGQLDNIAKYARVCLGFFDGPGSRGYGGRS